MFLPSWKGPWSPTLTQVFWQPGCRAYPHLWYKLGTIPANETAHASPQSWISQETPLPQASWNLHIIAVWNTASQLHLNKHSPTWLQFLFVTFLKQVVTSTTLLTIPYVMQATLKQRLVSRKETPWETHPDKMQTTKCSHRPASGEVAFLSHHSKSGLTLKLPIEYPGHTM